MAILKTDKHSVGYKLIGVSIPQWLHNYISLYCLAKNKTKSDILKGMLDSWYSQVHAKEPSEKLVQDIIEKANLEWGMLNKKCPEKTIEEFKTELEIELVNRGVGLIQRNTILKHIR